MSETKKHHATIVLERRYDATASRVFAEFANPVVRARWSAPSGDELVYEEAAFEVGGRDVFRCGPKGDLKFRGEINYHVIAPGGCVISSETLEESGQHLAVSLNTLELQEAEGATNLKLTIQIVSSAGKGMIEGFESGNRSALKGLAAHLAGDREIIVGNITWHSVMKSPDNIIVIDRFAPLRAQLLTLLAELGEDDWARYPKIAPRPLW